MDPVNPWWDRPIFEPLAVTPARIGLGLGILFVGLLVSRWLGYVLRRRAAGGRLDPGVLYSLDRLLHYAIVAASVVLGISALGVDMGSLAVIAGALGIGVGLGLQSITANVVSGLVLLFERPIKPGDRISLGNPEQEATGQINGYVRAIRLRATTIQTPDNILLVVPNADLVGRMIVNWSHGDPRIRIRLVIGVAYASDVDQVIAIMAEAARAHAGTLQEPPAEVRLVATSDSSLDFQLLVWIPDPRERGRVESALRLDILRRFGAAGISIPFPQREVRLLGGTPAAAPGVPPPDAGTTP